MSFAECMQDLEATNANARTEIKRHKPRTLDVLKSLARMFAPRAPQSRASS